MFFLKKIIFSLVVGAVLLAAVLPAFAQGASPVAVDFFYSPTCPHCAKEQVFLDEMQTMHPQLEINRWSVAESKSIELIKKFYQEHDVPEDMWGLVPATFIGDKFFVGFSDEVAQKIEKCLGELCQADAISPAPTSTTNLSGRIFSLPLIGRFEVSKLSPLALSAAVGFLDGFNACAMVALGFLLAVLITTGKRKRVMIIGGAFILVSGAVYYAFIAAWLNLFMFVSFIRVINVVISVVIIIFAAFLLKDYFYGVLCKVCDVKEGKESVTTKAQRKLFTMLHKFSVAEMPLILSILGVAVVAAGVNMIELFCSLGFPLAYTKILASHHLPGWSYYLHLLVYIIFYMIDDFIIFLIAVFTMRITKVSEKYLNVIKVVSGVVLLALGIIMLFKPDLLTL